MISYVRCIFDPPNRLCMRGQLAESVGEVVYAMEDDSHYEENLEQENHCRAPLHEECLKHHGYKGDPGVTAETCGAIGGRVQMILVWMRTLVVRNAFYLRRLKVTRVRP